MINDGQPIEELAETVSGHPFHGLVRGGVLVLPNGVQMTYRQPVGGNTYVFKKPGIAVITRSAADQVIDTAAGYQWRNYALISGTNSQLYGTDLGVLAWIYLAADGSRWQVRLQQTYTTFGGTSWDFYFAVSRFGEFGVAPESYTIHTTMTDLGQPTAERCMLRMNGKYNGINYIIQNQITTGAFWLSDVRPDGAEAIIGMDGDIDTNIINTGAIPAWLGEQGMPLGFLKFSFSGSGPGIAVSGSVHYSRSQVMPAIYQNGLLLNSSSSAEIQQNYPSIVDSVGRIVAVWYDSSSVAQPVTLDKHLEYAWVGWSNTANYDPVNKSYSLPSDCQNNAGNTAVKKAQSSYTLKFGAFSAAVSDSEVITVVAMTSMQTDNSTENGLWYDTGTVYPQPYGTGTDALFTTCNSSVWNSDIMFVPGPETVQSGGWSSYEYADYPGGLLPLYDFIKTGNTANPTLAPIFYRRLSSRCVGILAKHDIASEHTIMALLTPDGVPTNVDLYSGTGIGTKSTQPLPHNLGLYMPNSVPCTTSDPGTTNVGLDISGQSICFV